ncbi:IQ-DOMAIN 14-like protein [Tanacetum coccineum]
MGKVTTWFRGVLGMKKDKVNIDNSNAKTKKRWIFGKCMKHLSQRVTVENDSTRMRSCMSASEKEQNKHAIAVAATTAAVAGAQAAVAVVRLTSDDRDTLFSGREKWAATKIQSVYRGHLEKGSLQLIYSMQALLRAQLAVRSKRAKLAIQLEIRTDETKACEEMDSKLNITNKKKQILSKRKRILDVDKPPGLSRSYSFDSSLSGTRVVDAQDDNKILARQENVSRMIKSTSYDCGVLFLEEASSDDCSVEETEDLVKESLVSTHDENEGEKEEFDEVEDGSGWSRNVLLQYLFVKYLARRKALSRIEDIEHLIEASQSIPVRRVDSKSPASTSASCGNTNCVLLKSTFIHMHSSSFNKLTTI